MVSLVIVVIFIAMFSTSLTMYAMNGESLDDKVIGINKYSSDIIWLKTENSKAVGNESSYLKGIYLFYTTFFYLKNTIQ